MAATEIKLEYAIEVWKPYAMKCTKKIEQIQRNSCRSILQEYSRYADTSLFINRLNIDTIYTGRLIKQATMSYNIHYSLVDMFPPSYIQYANNISGKTDNPTKHCDNCPYRLMPIYILFFSHNMKT